MKFIQTASILKQTHKASFVEEQKSLHQFLKLEKCVYEHNNIVFRSTVEMLIKLK